VGDNKGGKKDIRIEVFCGRSCSSLGKKWSLKKVFYGGSNISIKEIYIGPIYSQ